MEKTSTKLEMTYGTNANTKVKLSLDDPVDNIDAEVVSAAMEEIVGLSVLQDSKGNLVTAALSAQSVTTSINSLF